LIKLKVTSLRGVPLAREVAAQFGPAGGTIGRAPTNTLVLDDPDRTVSRVHAQVECRDGRYVISDRGSNPLQHNGRPLGTGRESVLAPGDRLVIGGFELMVESAEDAAAAIRASVDGATMIPSDDDPFADLLEGLGPATPAAAPVASAASARSPAPASVESLLFPDPMEPAPGKPGPGAADDPFADLLGAGTPAAGIDALNGIPGLGPRGASPAVALDDLFGDLNASGPGGDPLAQSPLADPLHQPNTASQADPLAAMAGALKPAVDTRSDHLPIGQFAYTPPKEAIPPASGASSLLDDLGPAPAPAVAPVAAPTPAPIAAPSPASPSASPARSAPRPAAGSTSSDELLAAFLRGLNCSDRMPDALTPELMERIGTLLRSATEGTQQLLFARQELKRGVHAEVTMIASQANNPLKFSPTVELALGHLLGPPVRGYMPGAEAMQDAYDDLRAHEFGMMVGMRAALAHVLGRFTPEELEKKIAARSALDNLFAASRKAKLWDQFVALYTGIAAEAEDDFHSLFGKAFLKAYTEQMARLKSRG
jgi:FHA domain-containing protein